MTSTDTTLSVRVSERIKKSAETQAKRNELSLSDVIRVLLKEYAQGKIRIKIEQDK
ncbi:CopG family transcriptional regulator [Candidatus Peregrinibacteria bacterium]|jgi:antitoxin component of RelBE/YafQ-DinJ toxin-antitoxin module|nr:CopG family transcriptional regulator [Candidatus Peregrinibacteria bacterium]MBT3598854.1 CopG family transcriptional regulator [Candidatus Peregrinibacteria bacterium]MBT4366875.1 CopG family transcriptional regulator [Candidatus Peregrinibacteria bacterium]MBT4586170.1 CopG family transcriptional regulator [Candidatus Peregrinibacteria bacterium]MBT6730808.1 CopG family transcriptional regulator [Candidatus Peregrinibacteria bacterium]